jgi:hypothetical protein
MLFRVEIVVVWITRRLHSRGGCLCDSRRRQSVREGGAAEHLQLQSRLYYGRTDLLRRVRRWWGSIALDSAGETERRERSVCHHGHRLVS